MTRLFTLALAALMTLGMPPPVANATCRPIPIAAADAAKRSIVPDDLLRLRDLGFPDGSLLGYQSPLAVSPDGRRVAFILSEADPDANRYCRSLMTITVAEPGKYRVLADAGDLITVTDIQRDLYIPGGYPNVVQPAWSPDGTRIAFLRRESGVTQAWVVAASGGDARQMTRSDVDVEALAWNGDGSKLLVASRPGIARIRADHRAESLGGLLYDKRYMPNSSRWPLIPAPVAREIAAINLTSGSVARASSDDAQRFAPDLRPGPRPPYAAENDSYRAWTEHENKSPMSPERVHAELRGGQAAACPSPECGGSMYGLWALPGSDRVTFLKRSGWANNRLTLLDWKPGTVRPRRILDTDGVLNGCVPAAAALICTFETSTAPRKIVRVDPLRGAMTTLFDPNPEFRQIALGRVERFTWRNSFDIPAWSDLVLPPGYRGGAKLPLVVVQYHSDGFLRGGIGDEYPIQAFAARGFAVLSLERSAEVASARPELDNYDAINAAGHRGWTERRSQLSTLLEGIKTLVARGIVDPDRIGVTGLSDGSSTARFAIINSKVFAAAAISTCCIEPKTVMTYGGPAYADVLRRWGYPPASRDDPAFWKDYSMAMNAATMRTPLLMQLADDEYVLALETYTALRENGAPVEMRIFPDEYHIKWQPAHRRAIYDRNLDWFAFWLQGRQDPDPRKQPEYERWRKMRDDLLKPSLPSKPTSPAQAQ